jgi:hypothetical protein
MPMSSSGLVVTANSNARTVKAPNPIKSKGRRPQLWACRPAHGAARATMIWGTMINAEMISAESVPLRYASSSPASGSMEAFPS